VVKISSPTSSNSLPAMFPLVWNSSRLMEFNNGEILLAQPTLIKPRRKSQILYALFLEQMELRMLFTEVIQCNPLKEKTDSSLEEIVTLEQ